MLFSSANVTDKKFLKLMVFQYYSRRLFHSHEGNDITWREWYSIILDITILLYIAVYYCKEPTWLLHACMLLLAS